MRSFVPALVLILAVAACGDDDGEAAGPAEPAAPEPEPEAPAEPEPTPAQALAREVWRAAGGESLDRVAELRFRFVVVQGEQRAFEAMHRWNRETNRDHVTWTDREGRRMDALVDLDARIACGTIDGEIAVGDTQQTLSEQAYARWVNDSYWLIMPLKVLDPGVEHALEEPREHEGRRYEILRLSFRDVGLTPGDRYWLFVDPETHRVVRWEMQLEGQEGPPKGTSWTDWRQIGPLWIALDHATDDGERHIRFEDVEVLESPRQEDFVVEGCPE